MAGNLSWERAAQWEKLAQEVPEVIWEMENACDDNWKATIDHCDHKKILFLSKHRARRARRQEFATIGEKMGEKFVT